MTTIDEALEAFLAAQEARLAERTFRNYLDVIELFRNCMNDYGHLLLSEPEYEQWEKAFEGGDEEAFTRLFGPDKIPGEIAGFLDWYVIRKVMAGEEFLRACGTVTKKLGKWLEANGYLDEVGAADMVDLGAEAGSELPRAEKLARLLLEQSRQTSPSGASPISDGDWVEDRLVIERVEPGELWFEGGVGPVSVSREATRLAREGWTVTVTLARLDGVWRIFEVGNVYP